MESFCDLQTRHHSHSSQYGCRSRSQVPPLPNHSGATMSGAELRPRASHGLHVQTAELLPEPNRGGWASSWWPPCSQVEAANRKRRTWELLTYTIKKLKKKKQPPKQPPLLTWPELLRLQLTRWCGDQWRAARSHWERAEPGEVWPRRKPHPSRRPPLH